MRPLIYVRAGVDDYPEMCIDRLAYTLSPEKALDLATELLKLAGPKLKARATKPEGDGY